MLLEGSSGSRPFDGLEIPEPDRAVFVVEPHTWTRADVVDAMRSWGWLAPLLREHAAGAAALVALADSGGEPDAATVRTATESVRRRCGLLTKDETTVWLSAYQLELRDLVAYGQRVAARRAVSLDRLASFAPPGRSVGEAAALGNQNEDDRDLGPWATVVCSGRYHEAAQELAERAAASAAWRAASEPGSERRRPDALEVRREAECFERSVITDDALQHALDRHQLEWIVVESDRLTFGEVDAAKEARLCLLEGEAIDALAPHAVRSESGAFLVGDIDADRQALYAGAIAGEVLGPFADDRGFVVWSVTGRGEPTLADPETRRRAELEVTRQALQREVNARVRWPAAT